MWQMHNAISGASGNETELNCVCTEQIRFISQPTVCILANTAKVP